MKIALLAPPYLPVPPVGYGGTEKIVYHLAQGLVGKGHDVTLFASGDSVTRAKLDAISPKALGNSGEIKNQPLMPLLHYINCFSKASEFDIIHNHAQYYAMFMAELVKTPVVHTIHGSFHEGEVPEEKRTVLKRFKNHHFVSISHNQQESLPELNYAGTVYNGLDIKDYPFIGNPKGDYLLWVGRITEKKGPDIAIEVAKNSNMPLVIAAAVDPIDMPYFEKEVKPLIDGEKVSFVGELHGDSLSNLYGNAYCTLFPISWHEPFGLVMIESMATGTPVIGYNIGSVAEIIKDGETGFVVKDAFEMTEAVKNIGKINRSDCRKRVEENFTVEKMVDGYESVYRRILDSNL